MILKGKAHKYGSNVNTDEIIPARYLNTSEYKELAAHCMEDIDADFIKNMKSGDFIVAENNFGCGSSREHAPISIKVAGVAAVIATSFARIFLRHTYNLSNDFDTINDEQNHIPGIRSKSYLAFTLGKFSLSDIFDNNSFCHDPRTQFMNWSIMSSGAWDYPANTKGYTLGMAMELVNQTDWALRLAAVMVVTDANHSTFDTKIDKANGLCAEIMKKYTLFNSFGFIRLLGFVNHARMGNYNEAIQIKTDTVDITKTRAYGRAKFGFGLNIEQQLNDKTGLFLRTSWNDGQTETWAFTEIDRSLSIGAQFHGGLWGRETDRIGLACVLNGISVEHRNYLASGGYGFIIGDGKLNYGLETIFETYYSFFIHDADHFWFTPDYQFIINPAYNKDRGPVHTLSLRIHIEF